MSVLLYAPSIQLIVATTDRNGNSQVYDVSKDIISGTCTLAENTSHTMQCTLLNNGRRYDRLFKPNDRFVLYMKRLQKLLVMTGYLDTVPFFSIWPRSITITGESTLKRLKYHYWDPGSVAAFNLFNQVQGGDPNVVNQPSQNQFNDSGMQDKAVALLTQVGQWDQTKIHFTSLPTSWISKVAALYELIGPQLGLSLNVISPMGIVNGVSPFSVTNGIANGNQLATISPGVNGPDGSGLPDSLATATLYQGAQDIQPLASWYAQMQWQYNNLDGSPSDTVSASVVRPFLAEQKLLVGIAETGQFAVVQIAGWGPPAASGATLGLSQDALDAIGFSPQFNQVMVAWVNNPAAIGVGPFTPSTSSTLFTGGAGGSQGSTSPNAFQTNIPPQGVTSTVAPQYGSTSNLTASPNANAAVAFSVLQAKNNVPYSQADPQSSSTGFDCSGLVQAAWASAGVAIDRTTFDQYANLYPLPTPPEGSQGAWLPGDLLYYFQGEYPQYPNSPGHVVMYQAWNDGSPTVIQSPTFGADVQIVSLYMDGFMAARRVTGGGANGGGTPTGTGAATSASSSTTAIPNINITNTGELTISGSASEGSSSTSFLTIWDWYDQAPDPVSQILTGFRALMNDVPLLPMIETICNASMRSFCSAPNGDFIAWFPDYFNAYGCLGTIDIEPIELQDFTVMWSDLNMVTHQYAAGTYVPTASDLSGAGGVVSTQNMVNTGGVATIDFPAILANLLNTSQNDPTFSTAAIYQRFGARPNYQPLGTIVGPLAEFWYALYLFQQNWASMFNAQVNISFMPEVYPGMILRIPSQSFQCYVEQVTHSWDLTDSGIGFSTQVNITAPSSTDPNNPGLLGFSQGSAGPV
jgi:cell wall-associated NlpC family hydrolase